MNDYVYIFDKVTKEKILLGEIQDKFNMSFVIDGTKDTFKPIVMSYSLVEEIEPETILYHENTQTWWIVSHDKVERYLNENGYLYVHELSCEGAIELTNARDLTDCGFNQNKYTISQFLLRLFALSEFEFPISISQISSSAIDLDKKVEYVKTYENYTLLSAIRDFLSGYNCVGKLRFVMNNGQTEIVSAELDIVSKTGNQSSVIDTNDEESEFYNYFNDIKEIKTMDKNSFGTRVISNAQNVIATKDKTYPQVGAVKISSTNFVSNSSNAILRLPSKAFKVNWVEIITDLYIQLVVPNMGGADHYAMYLSDPSSVYTQNSIIDKFKELIDQYDYANRDSLLETLETYKQDFIDTIVGNATVAIYDGNQVDPSYNNGQGILVKGENVPKIPSASDGGLSVIQLTLVENNEKNNIPNSLSGIVWTRGSNIIEHFNFITGHSYVTGISRKVYGGVTHGGLTVRVIWGDSQNPSNNDGKITWGRFSLRCNYIPMSDLKIKIDNQRDKNDIQLYNQNGKLTDSNALSKLLNSYAREISSDTITKYCDIYSTNLSNVLGVGTKFWVNNEIYIVNNLSLDLSPNENGYLVECEYTMSKQFAVKSLMVNANTNIRDYGIPQNFNVERKQVYRDYYEFDFVKDDNADNDPYCEPYETLYFGDYPKELCSYVGVIKCEYSHEIGNTGNKSETWYYQLDTTKYELDKTFYVVLTFNDNNIIGYSSQNVYSGFDITRVFQSWTDEVVTPVSYVDENGELLGIDILYCDNEQITSIYEEYKEEHSSVPSYDADKSLYNFSCFIPSDIYDKALNNNMMQIGEGFYNKDALEVPVFEYACQIGDSKNVFVGDNILSQDTSGDYIYLYQYRRYAPYTATPINCVPLNPPTYDSATGKVTCTNACEIRVRWLSYFKDIDISCYINRTYDINTQEFTNSIGMGIVENEDFVLFRHKINKNNGQLVSSDLVLVARNVPSDNLISNKTTLRLYPNHWRLK